LSTASEYAVVESAVIIADWTENGFIDAMPKSLVASVLRARQAVITRNWCVDAAIAGSTNILRARDAIIAEGSRAWTGLATDSRICTEIYGANVVVVANDRRVRTYSGRV